MEGWQQGSLGCTQNYEPQVACGLVTRQKFGKGASFLDKCDAIEAGAKIVANWLDVIPGFLVSKGSLQSGLDV
jgi:hypothetical protein